MPPTTAQKSQPKVPKAIDPGKRSAESHYFRGNRFYELRLWDKAVAEWRRAAQLWQDASTSTGKRIGRFYHLRTALTVLFTVLILHQLLFVLFPRDPFDLAMISADRQNRSWWESLMDTGRPRAGAGHKMTVREWWSRFKSRLREGAEGERLAGEGSVRRDISERWAELLRRYGRFGPLVTWDLDYSVISGNGLSRLGDYDNAVRILESGIREANGEARLADLYQGLANAHYYAGYDLQPDGTAKYNLNQVGRAARAYEKSLEFQPRSLSFGNLGWMYFLTGDYERSERYSKRALDMNGTLHYVRLNLGLNYLVQGKNRESFESYYEVVLRDPPSEVYLGGITDLREIVRDNAGRYPFAYLMIGVLALKNGDLSTSHEALTRFRAGPSQGNYWNRLAERLVEQMDSARLER